MTAENSNIRFSVCQYAGMVRRGKSRDRVSPEMSGRDAASLCLSISLSPYHGAAHQETWTNASPLVLVIPVPSVMTQRYVPAPACVMPLAQSIET